MNEDWYNTRAEYKSQDVVNRNYLCLVCGRIIRASAHYLKETPSLPQHCGKDAPMLLYEQTVAASQLDPDKRAAWFLAGAHFALRGGKRKWKPVINEARCHGCHRGRER